MSVTLIACMMLIGGLGGFAAGLLGFGGGVVMFPLLYYIPPIFGIPSLDARTVAAVVVSQVFFSTVAAGIAHLRNRRVQWWLVIVAGSLSAIGSFVAGAASVLFSERFLLVLFALVTLLVAGMMLLKPPPEAQEDLLSDSVAVPLVPLALVSLVIGLIVGFLGAGNFIFVPLLIYVLKVPTRIAIASSLLIAMMNTSFGFLGKLVTGQIPLFLTTLVVSGAMVGALLGESVHRRVPTRALRRIYASMVVIIAARVWITLLASLR
ncbi:MAG TPA: sulfite exporter TauE/SafE family protein [Candidatus Binatia bacterium]|nr:sulfite exporter TauE/SafE family protein [Candidatus Binatia bacterium]